MERPPEAFICPIGLEVMRQPFVAADGHSYEEGSLRVWLRDHTTSPMTNAPLPCTMIVPNHALRAAIEEWESQRPLELDPDSLTILPDERLGNGSFGHVVAGLFTMHGRPRPVAVKTLPAMSRAEQRSQFARELKAHDAAQRSADRVCRLLGVCDKGGHTCLVMKRYARSLADWLAAGALPPPVVRRVGAALCRTLAQLHGAGVVVQDIKPANVLLDEHDEPVFSDFGIASVVERTTLGVRPTSVKGTFNYMAPETFEDSQYGKEVDIWSMGCLVVEMATGVAPWARLQMQQIITAVLIRKQMPEVPDGLPEAVARCFAFDPRGRPTAAALADALADAQATAPADGHMTEMQALRDAHAAAMQALRDGHAVRIQNYRDGHAAEMQALREGHAAEIRTLGDGGLAERLTLHENFTLRIKTYRESHAAELLANGEHLRTLREGHAAEMLELNNKLAVALRCEEKSASCLAATLDQLGSAKTFDEFMCERALRDELEKVHELCTAHEDEIERLKRSLSISERIHEALKSKPNVQQHFGSISLATCHWAAKRGDATAQFTMANLYSEGLEGPGLLRDMSKALKWWRRATDQGHAEASAALESWAAQGVFEELTEKPDSIRSLINVFRKHSYVGGSIPKYLVMKAKAGTLHTLISPTAGIRPDSFTGGAYSPLMNFTDAGDTLRDGDGKKLTCCGVYSGSGNYPTRWIYGLIWKLKPVPSDAQSGNQGRKSLSHAIAYYACKSCCGLLGVPMS